MLKNRQNSLRFKIWLGFALVNVILISAIVISLWQIHNIGGFQTTFLSQQKQVSSKNVSIRQDLSKNIIYLQNYLMSNEQEFKDKMDALWEKEIKPNVEYSYAVSRQLDDPTYLSQLKRTQKSLLKLRKDQQELLDNITPETAAQYKTQIADLFALSDSISDELESFNNTKDIDVAKKIKQVQDHIEKIMLIEFILLGLGITLSLILAVILMRSISLPVKGFVSFANKLSKGKLDQMLNIRESTEYEELSDALNQVVETLRNMTDIAEHIAMGDFSRRVEVKSPEDRLAITVNKMMDNFDKIVDQANAIAEGRYTSEVKPQSSSDKIGQALQNMTKALRQNKKNSEEHVWVQHGMTELAGQLSDIGDIETLCNTAITVVCQYVEAGMGAVYRFDTASEELYLSGAYAQGSVENYTKRFKVGEGIVGQTGKNLKPTLLRDVPHSTSKIESGTTSIAPKNIYISPLVYEGKLIGVMEISAYKNLSQIEIEFLLQTSPLIGGHLRTAEQHLLTEKLLKEIEDKAHELEKASQYKSEFLANMSHELRTPLNSLIILTKLMLKNKEANLTNEQLESLNIVFKNSEVLLLLINDILDLSKVEAGKIEIILNHCTLSQVVNNLESQFTHIVEEKGIGFNISIDDSLSPSFYTDEHRLSQILRNLLSNAIKFTEKGSVSLRVTRPDFTPSLAAHNLVPEKTIAFEVADTGIGIANENQASIFEPFRQADGSTSRKYGGTGLGLSISSKLANLLGGFLELQSELGVGSTFILYLPENLYNSTSQNLTTEPKVASTSPVKSIPEETIHAEPIAKTVSSTISWEKIKDKKILIAEPDMRTNFLLSKELSSHGANIIKTTNLESTLQTLSKDASNNIDALLLEEKLLEEDSFSKIRSIDSCKGLSIIILKEKLKEDEKHLLLKNGATHVVEKPVDMALLVTLI